MIKNPLLFGTQERGDRLNYVEIYKSVLNFHRSHSNVENTEEFWQSVIDDSEQIFSQYNKCRFVKELLMAVINELERKVKEVKASE